MTNDLLLRPSLRRHLAAHVVSGEGVLLLSGSSQHLLTGRVYERLVPLLTGERTTDDLVDHLEAEFPPEEVYFALMRLTGSGLVREAGEAASAEATAYWDASGIAPGDAMHRLREHGLALRWVGFPPARDFGTILGALGLTLGPEGAWDLVLTDDYLNPELASLNRHALANQRPWLLCKPVGQEVWVGPLFVPGETSCWACLAYRLEQHRPLETYLAGRAAEEARRPADTAAIPATIHLALSLLARGVSRAIATANTSALRDTLETYDSLSGVLTRHSIRRRPQCGVCGRADSYTRQADAPVVLSHRPKRLTDDSDQRSASLARSYARFRRHVGPITGIVSGLTPHRAKDARLIHAYSAGPNVALRYRGLDGLRAGLGSTSAGKGATTLRARVSALGEALERYSGVYQGDEPRIRARLAELPGAIHPNLSMQFSETQYRQREARNHESGAADYIPPAFDPTRAIDWTPVWSLISGRRKYLPTALLYHDCPSGEGGEYCVATSNGAAAGNCFEEAVLHGLLELVERDCVAVWWYNRVRRPAVDLMSLADPYAERLSQEYAALGRDWWVLDLTNDLQIPCYAAVSHRIGAGAQEPLFGFGAHLDPGIALRRALTEMNQILVARDSANSPFQSVPRLQRWLREATLQEHLYLVPSGETPMRQASRATDDLLEDVEFCCARLGASGMDALVLDQTRPDVDVPVAKVVVPGLRHFRARLAPGRLFDVPADLGWLPRRRTETELNPVAFVL